MREQCPICVNVAPWRRVGNTSIHFWGQWGDVMITLRTAAIVITGAGVFAGLPLTAAKACDDDRFPCPVTSEATPQETAVAPAEAAPSAQPLKKTNHPARLDEKMQSKVERHAPRVAIDREAPGSGTRSKASKTAVQKPGAAPIAQKASVSQNAAAVAQPSLSDQSPKEESRNEGLLAVAGTVWPALPNADSSASTAASTVAEAAQATPSDAVQVSDANQLNQLDRAAIADRTGKASWISYLFLILSAVLAAAAKWLLPRMRVRVQAPSSKSTNAQEQLADCSRSISR